MSKKLYLKYFIFFVVLVSYSFNNYAMDDYDDSLARQFFRNGYGLNFNNPYKSVKADTPIFDVVQRSVKVGAAQALTKEALRVLSRVLEIVPYSVNKLIAMIRIYAYKASFGNTGLTARDLTKFNNRIHTLCSPFASSQVGNMRKTKRVATIESEQGDGQAIDKMWEEKRESHVSELKHIVSFLRNTLPCYNAHYQSIDASAVEKGLAKILYAISTENNNEIQYYIIRLMGYINKLIELLESFKSLDNALERADETKQQLNIIRSTFEHIATFLADSNIKGSGAFQKLSEDAGNKRDLMMDLLGNGGLK